MVNASVSGSLFAEPLYYSLLIHIGIRAGGGIFTYGLSGDNTQVTKAIDKSILDPTDADDNNGRKGNANYPAVTKIRPLLDSQPPTYSTLSYKPTNNGI